MSTTCCVSIEGWAQNPVLAPALETGALSPGFPALSLNLETWTVVLVPESVLAVPSFLQLTLLSSARDLTPPRARGLRPKWAFRSCCPWGRPQPRWQASIPHHCRARGIMKALSPSDAPAVRSHRVPAEGRGAEPPAPSVLLGPWLRGRTHPGHGLLDTSWPSWVQGKPLLGRLQKRGRAHHPATKEASQGWRLHVQAGSGFVLNGSQNPRPTT